MAKFKNTLPRFYKIFLKVFKPQRMRPIPCCNDINPLTLTPLINHWQFKLTRTSARIFRMNVPINDVTHNMLHFKSMNFAEYQAKAATTALYPNQGNNLYYPALGLGGETGEVLNKIKKVMRDHGGNVTDEYREILRGELGDVMWYVTALARELGLNLDDIAQANLEKLFSRKERDRKSVV